MPVPGVMGGPVGSGPLAVRDPVVLPLPRVRVSFTVNYKTKTLSGLWPGGAATLWEPFPRTPFFLWVSWPGCHWAPINSIYKDSLPAHLCLTTLLWM